MNLFAFKRSSFLAALLVLLGACTVDSGTWHKADVDTAARDADLLACQAQVNQQTQVAALNPSPIRTARYIYTESRHGLFGPGGKFDDSDVRRQIEGEIAAMKRMRWRAQFGACLEAESYRYRSLSE